MVGAMGDSESTQSLCGLVDLLDEIERLAVRLKYLAGQVKDEVYSNVKWDGRTTGVEWQLVYYATSLEWEVEITTNVAVGYSKQLRQSLERLLKYGGGNAKSKGETHLGTDGNGHQ